jgi:hypothetical protein
MKNINEIALAELERALEASGYRAHGSIDHLGPGGNVLQCMLDHKHFDIDLDLLRDLVKSYREQEDAYLRGFDDGLVAERDTRY